MPCVSPTRSFWLLLLSLTLLGCGRGHELPTAPVTGKILVDGRPVAKGQVIFAPEGGRAATGILQPDGTFTLSTYRPNDGAVLGKHTVTVISAEPVEGAAEGIDAEMRWLVPRRYSDPGTSGLTFEVTPGGPNRAVLELTTRPTQ